MQDEILGCKPCVLNGNEFTVRKANLIVNVDSRRQIKRQSEVQKGARRLRCLEHLARTQWKSYGKISDTRNKHKPFQSEPLTEDVTRLKLKQTSTTGFNLPAINEPGSYFLGRDVNVPIRSRAPIAPVRGMSTTAHILKKFGHPQQESKILYDPHRTNKGQKCKYTKSMKIPAESWLLGCYTGTRGKQLEFGSNDTGYSVENDVNKKHSNIRKQVHAPLSKLRKFPTVSNISSGNGVLKVIYTKSKISRGGVPVVLQSFDFDFQTSNCAMKQVTGNTADRKTTTGKDVQRKKTEVVMQNANRLLKSPLKPEINSSQGSTDAKRTLSENPDPRELDRILQDDPLSNHPYPDEIQNPDGKLIVWPKESSSMNTADSIATHKLPEVLRNLPKTHVNLKHKVQDWIDNRLKCSYSLE